LVENNKDRPKGRSDSDESKELLKQALNEWLESKYATFGKFSFHAIMAFLFSAIVYLAFTTGWRPDI
jgi:hypothetical protein